MNLRPANCSSVKIDLWLCSNTAEISLKCLTCCNKLRATISYICSPCRSLLYWMFLEVFPDVTQVVKSPVGQCGFCWWFIFRSANLTLLSSQNKKEFSTLPLLTVSQTSFRLKTCKEPGCVPCQTATTGASPPALNGKLCQWSSSFCLGLTVPLSWQAGEAASHRQSRPISSQWEGWREVRHTVAKTTTFEWVCSWNAARWQLYNRLKGGVRLQRGSDKGSSREAVEFFFFHCPLFIYIPSVASASRNSIQVKQSPWTAQQVIVEGKWRKRFGVMSVTSFLSVTGICPHTDCFVIDGFSVV